jgi:RimJ/RimL family protein N-acetyltransferase
LNERHALATARLDLVPTEPGYAERTWTHLSDERMWRFFPAMRPPTIEALRLRYERFAHPMPYLGAPERWENWICIRREDEAAVGEAQATYAGASCYLAYGVFPAFQRQGFAREAMSAVLRHAHDVHRSRVAIAEMAASNAASIGVARALGLVHVKSKPGEHVGYDGTVSVYRLQLRPSA